MLVHGLCRLARSLSVLIAGQEKTRVLTVLDEVLNACNYNFHAPAQVSSQKVFFLSRSLLITSCHDKHLLPDQDAVHEDHCGILKQLEGSRRLRVELKSYRTGPTCKQDASISQQHDLHIQLNGTALLAGYTCQLSFLSSLRCSAHSS